MSPVHHGVQMVYESHEMFINKDCKTSVIHPIPDYINRIAQHLQYVSKAIKNIQSHHKTREKKIATPYATKPNDFKCEQNVFAMFSSLEQIDMCVSVCYNSSGVSTLRMRYVGVYLRLFNL